MCSLRHGRNERIALLPRSIQLVSCTVALFPPFDILADHGFQFSEFREYVSEQFSLLIVGGIGGRFKWRETAQMPGVKARISVRSLRRDRNDWGFGPRFAEITGRFLLTSQPRAERTEITVFGGRDRLSGENLSPFGKDSVQDIIREKSITFMISGQGDIPVRRSNRLGKGARPVKDILIMSHCVLVAPNHRIAYVVVRLEVAPGVSDEVICTSFLGFRMSVSFTEDRIKQCPHR